MLRIRLFGRCSFESDTADIPTLNCAKARELLGYLTCHRDRELSREAVIGKLWGALQEEQGKRTMRQTLWQLQSAFESFQFSATKPFIEANGEWLRLNPNSTIWLDVVRFEQLEKATRLASGQPPTTEYTDNLKEAVGLYRGDLMEECFMDWCIRERDHFRKLYLRMLLRLMAIQRETGDCDGALASALRVLREEPASEKAHGTLMWIYCREGDRTSALRQFQQYKQIVREEFNAPPAKALVDLYKKISQELGIETDNGPSADDSGKDSPESHMIAILGDIRREIVLNREDIRQLKESIDRKDFHDEEE